MGRAKKRPAVSGKSAAVKTSCAEAENVVNPTVAKDKIDESSKSIQSLSSEDSIPEPPQKISKSGSSSSSATPASSSTTPASSSATPASSPEEYVDAMASVDSVFTAVTERQDLLSISLKNGNQLEAYEKCFKITTKSGETIIIKGQTTSIRSGPCLIDIKDGVIRIQSKEVDTILNFQPKSDGDSE